MQKYIQSLGFGTKYPPMNKESQDVRIDQYGQDNAFETDHPKDEIRVTGRRCRRRRRRGGRPARVRARDMSDIQSQKLGAPVREPLACVMDLDGEVHDDGRIWSQALWTTNRSIGHRRPTR